MALALGWFHSSGWPVHVGRSPEIRALVWVLARPPFVLTKNVAMRETEHLNFRSYDKVPAIAGRNFQEIEMTDLSQRPDGGEVLQMEPRVHDESKAVSRPLRVALVGTFAPQKCGIATFTTDIFEQFRQFQPDVSIDLHILRDPASDDIGEGDHGQRPAYINPEDPADFARAARQMNEDGVDAVWLQHEFGIFGGECGAHVLELIDRVAAPLIVTMHTVLPKPSAAQEAITRRLVARASRLMVMCKSSRDLLIERFGASGERICMIEHGAPDRALEPLDADRDQRTLMTFGLIGPGKGLETAIEALPAIVARHPSTRYRIAGASHPNEVRRNGEVYRRGLEALAVRLGVSKHIEWVDRFLESDELLDMIGQSDIYLTPYPNMQQSTSGTLSYAVALGRAVISTPYIHARELLGDVGGVLVPPNDAAAIAREVNHLLDDPAQLAALQLKTYRRGRRTTWRHFAGNARAMLDAAVFADGTSALQERATPGLAAFDTLCDDTGILQHSRFVVPDRNHGYCLDDAVRALMLVHRVNWRGPGEELRRGSVFAAFIQHAWNPDRKAFRNFMNFDRSWCEDVGSEDSNGRTIWALGDCVELSRLAPMRDWARQGFKDFAPIALDFTAPRALAFAGLGAAAHLRASHDSDLARAIVQRCGDMLEKLIDRTRRPDWTWFETVLGYDNPRLSQALIECGTVTGNDRWVECGLDSLRWILENQCSVGGNFRPVGSDTFGKEGDILPFDQQPLEAWAAIEACATAHRHQPAERVWTDHARRAYRWFLGANDRNVALVDLQLGTCMDGVTPHGANRNCGAESLLAFQLAYYAYEQLAAPAGQDGRTDVFARSQG